MAVNADILDSNSPFPNKLSFLMVDFLCRLLSEFVWKLLNFSHSYEILLQANQQEIKDFLVI